MGVATLLVSLLAAGVAIFAADFARRQALSAKRQADAAEDQAAIAGEQARAARDQVAEARRANELAETQYRERRAREAVRWTAILAPSRRGLWVRNIGTESAHNVVIKLEGAEEDWTHPDAYSDAIAEVAPNEPVSVPIMAGWGSPAPHTVWVAWESPHGSNGPLAVEVKRS